MAEPQRWYVVCCLQPWSSLDVTAHLGAWKQTSRLQDPDHQVRGQPVGYLAVFSTKEEAVQWGEGTQVIEIIAASAQSAVAEDK